MYKFTTLINRRAKTVNNLRVVGCESGDNSSTFMNTLFCLCNHNSGQGGFINKYILPKSTNFYTTLKGKFNLLYKTFTYNPQPLLMRLLEEI
jgi:hypothetical protein